MTSLFDPIAFGAIAAPNRIMMAPLTRGRATRQLAPAIRRAFKGTLILNSDYSLDDASQALRLGEADAIAFGRAPRSTRQIQRRFTRRDPRGTQIIRR